MVSEACLDGVVKQFVNGTWVATDRVCYGENVIEGIGMMPVLDILKIFLVVMIILGIIGCSRFFIHGISDVKKN